MGKLEIAYNMTTFGYLVDDVLLYLARLSGEYVHRLLSMTSKRYASLLGDLRHVPVFDPIMERLVRFYPKERFDSLARRWKVYVAGHCEFQRSHFLDYIDTLGATAYDFKPNLEERQLSLKELDQVALFLATVANGNEALMVANFFPMLRRMKQPFAPGLLEIATKCARLSPEIGLRFLKMYADCRNRPIKVSVAELCDCYDPLLVDSFFSPASRRGLLAVYSDMSGLLPFLRMADERLIQVILRVGWTLTEFAEGFWESCLPWTREELADTILASSNLTLMQWAQRKGLFDEYVPSYSLKHPSVAVLEYMETALGVIFDNRCFDLFRKWGENDGAVFDWVYTRWFREDPLPVSNVSINNRGQFIVGFERIKSTTDLFADGLATLVRKGKPVVLRRFMERGHWDEIREMMLNVSARLGTLWRYRNRGHYELVAMAMNWKHNPLSPDEGRVFLNAFRVVPQ